VIWIIASAPLWLLGAGLFVLPAWGVVELVRKWRTIPQKEAENAVSGMILLLLLSAVVLLIAAKVAS
jgi:hypothetical protein